MLELRYIFFNSFILLLVRSSSQTSVPICNICNCTYASGLVRNVSCTKLIEPGSLFNQTVAFGNSSITNFDRFIVNHNEMRWFSYAVPYEDLTVLDLSHNNIQNMTDNIFAKLQRLEVLVLSFNLIDNLSPNVFQGVYLPGEFNPLHRLRVVMLDHNQFHSLDGDLFEHTPNVEHLYLSNNPLEIIDTQTAIAITNLAKLKTLDLSFTKLSNLPHSFLHTPKYITSLKLTGNEFTKIPEELKEAHNLTELILDENPITNLTSLNGFPPLPTLKILHLNRMPELQTIEDGSMSSLPQLEELYITNNNKLSYFSDSAFVSKAMILAHNADLRPPIRKLHLLNNKLSYLNMSLLGRWKSLSELDLRGNPWACELENQWMVTTLMPIYLTIDEFKAKEIRCGTPVEMESKTFYDMYLKKYIMRPPDIYGARPEQDAIFLVGTLAGVLLLIPLLLFILYSYKRHWFGIFDDSPAAFTRQFYKRAGSSSDFYEY